jgi:hypothetical protein
MILRRLRHAIQILRGDDYLIFARRPSEELHAFTTEDFGVGVPSMTKEEFAAAFGLDPDEAKRLPAWRLAELGSEAEGKLTT